MTAARPLFLVGFMGAGKSTVGPILAKSLGLPFADLDDVIESGTGMTVDALFAERGEEGFRAAEYDALEAVLETGPAVVACGGGIVTYEDSRSVLAAGGDVVYLAVTADESLDRVRGQLHGRPLLRGADPAGAATLLGLRERLYDQVADFTVDTVDRSPADVARRIQEWVAMQS